MSKKVLLISIPEIIAGSVIQENVDPKVLSKTLSIVQEVHYKPILGTELYDDFIDAVELKILSGTPLNSVFQGLLDVSKPYLINRTVAEFIVINQYKVTAKGILTMKDNFANNLSEGDLQAVKDLYDNYSTSFKIDLIEYLETSGLKKSDQVNEITSDASGWYLGIETECNTACDTPTETIPIDYSGLTASPLFSDKKVLIISIPEIISSSIIQENVDQKILTKTLLMVQEIYLRQILKPNLYNFLIDSIYRKVVSGDTLTNGVENLLDVVKPYLINKTVAEFVYVNQYKVSNKGILSMSDTSANNLSESDLQAVKDYYDNVSTTYKINLIEFLECNNLMYKDSEEFSSDATGWYLEGVDTCDNSLGQSCGSIQLDFRGPAGTSGTSGISGLAGSSGTSGISGTSGKDGQNGISSSCFLYQAREPQLSGDPGIGHIIWNTLNQSGATQLNISHKDEDQVDIDLFLSLLVSGQTLVIQDRTDSDNFQVWTITGTPTKIGSTYWTIPVIIKSSSGTGSTNFANNHKLILCVVSMGKDGTSGLSGTIGTSGISGLQGTNGTSGTSFTDGTLNTSFQTNMGTGFNFPVRDIATDTDGSIICSGGFFNLFNGVLANRLLKLNPDGTLNTTFATNLGSGFDAEVSRIKIQRDGKILAAGLYTNSFSRVNANGTFDTAFNSALSTFNNFCACVNIQSDDKILVGGGFENYAGNGLSDYIVRLNSNGTLDTSFNTNLGQLNSSVVRDIQVQSDDKILMGGSFVLISGITRNRFVRLNSDGSIDTAFCNNLGTAFNGDVNVIAIQNDGKILVGGSFTTFNGNTRNRLIRLNSDGTEDTTFYTNLGTGVTNNTVSTIEVQNDGRIFVGGGFTTFNGNTRNRAFRLNSNGTEDTSFYNNFLPNGFNSTVSKIHTNRFGRLFFGGNFGTPSNYFLPLFLPSNIFGSNGTSGISGTSGTSGISGLSGTSGTSGISGLSGTSGTSGRDGNPFTGGTINAPTRFTSGLTANTLSVTTISATTYQNLPFFITNVTRTVNPLTLNVTGNNNQTTGYTIQVLEDVSGTGNTLSFPNTVGFVKNFTINTITGVSYNSGTGVVNFGGTGTYTPSISGFTTELSIGPKFNIPVPKIKLKVGDSNVDYLLTDGTSGGSFIIKRIPQIITQDLSSELITNFDVFIEMVHYARSRPKATDVPGVKVDTRGGWVVEPDWIDTGNSWVVPWPSNFPNRANTMRQEPFNGGILQLDRRNWIPVTALNTKYDTVNLFHNKFIMCDIIYRDNVGAEVFDSARIVPCQNMKKHGRNKTSKLYPYSPWVRPLHVAFRYIVWMPNANGGLGQILSGPLSSPVHIKFSRFPYQYNYQASQDNGVASADVVSTVNEYTCYFDESLMKKIHRGNYGF